MRCAQREWADTIIRGSITETACGMPGGLTGSRNSLPYITEIPLGICRVVHSDTAIISHKKKEDDHSFGYGFLFFFYTGTSDHKKSKKSPIR